MAVTVEKDWAKSIEDRYTIFIEKDLLKKQINYFDISPVWKKAAFCNVHRVLDRYSRELRELTQVFYCTLETRWFLRWLASKTVMSSIINDLVNHVPEFQAIWQQANQPYQSPEQYKGLFEYIKNIQASGKPIYSGSFIVIHQTSQFSEMQVWENMVQTAHYYVQATQNNKNRSFKDDVQVLCTEPCISEFTAGCLLTDWMNDVYFTPDHIDYHDIGEFATTGPGALKGMGLFFDEKRANTKDYLTRMKQLTEWSKQHVPELLARACARAGITIEQLPELCKKARTPNMVDLANNWHAMDTEHWLCEFYKWHKISNNKTTNRLNLYRPHEGINIWEV